MGGSRRHCSRQGDDEGSTSGGCFMPNSHPDRAGPAPRRASTGRELRSGGIGAPSATPSKRPRCDALRGSPMRHPAIRRAGLPVVIVALLAFPGATPAQAPKVADEGPEYDVAVEANVMIPMRDGVLLAADLYRPAS